MRIGIVGAGLAGLSAAAFLARDGHRVEILEKAPDLHPTGAGLLLQPPGAAILDRLGALAPLLPNSAKISKLDARTARGRKLLALDYADLGPGLYGLGLQRGEIWSALRDAALAAGAQIIAGQSVTRIEESGIVRFAKGQGRFYDLVVVASGAHTDYWRAGKHHRARLYPWGCLWTTIELPQDWRLDTLQQRCRGAKVMLGVLPTGIRDGKTVAALFWSLRNDQLGAWQHAPFSDWQDEVAKTWPEIGDMVAGLKREDLHHTTYRDVWANPPYLGKVLAIGDAAHGTSPQLGQGATQALRDAEALAEAMRLHGSLDQKLTTYWKKRKASTRYYRRASRVLTPVFQSANPLLGPLRDLIFAPIGAIPPIKRQSLLTLAAAKTGLFTAEKPAAIPIQDQMSLDRRGS